MRLPLLPLLTIFFGILSFNVFGQNTPPDPTPVTLSGSLFRHSHLVPVTNNKYKATDVVGFIYTNDPVAPWQQIPIQVDERDTVDAGKIYHTKTWVDTTWSRGYSTPQNPSGGYYSSFKTVEYCDSNMFTGADRYPAFDVDDEVSFMLRDLGTLTAPVNTNPPAGVDAGSGVEARIQDKITGQYHYIYFFNRAANSSLVPSANKSYITDFTFKFKRFGRIYDLSGYKSHYDLFSGPNPEYSSVTTPYYHRGFADRWIDDTLKIERNSISGLYLNIYDKHSFQLKINSCGRSEYTFSGEDTINRPSPACNPAIPSPPQAEGAFVTNISGPIRAIRSFMGTNSGPLSERVHIFYEQAEAIRTFVRVHPVAGGFYFYDYNPAIGSLTYSNNNNNPATQPKWANQTGPTGFVVDGVPDTGWKNGPLKWELINTNYGSIFRYDFGYTDIPAYKPGTTGEQPSFYTQSYYLDDYNAQANAPKNGGVTCQCTGDAHAWGASGFIYGTTPDALNGPNMQPTDPRQPGHYNISNLQINFYLPSNSPQADTTKWIAIAKAVEQPASAIVINWPYDNNGVGSFNLYPNPTTGLVNVDVTGEVNEKLKVEFYNIIGRKIYTLQGISSLRETINLAADGSSGVYVARIYIGNNVFGKKIILAR